ncbi:Tyrosine/DOPA decarboxylase 2 [Hibiscus syriacus]|uniref:Tyrosine/DOPA decarboxylase 2 n=1 Tax=Hibiscus syriacus TaxID=106335 RepID=A0A6A2YJ32_HIBSY|nr:tyrosine decarboxylase 1-like [Hibiscus syriacus]KAE8677017.1 Tyrosine/DOPA decarboxylase 2 [Hibiscus syriacus]
MGSESRESFLPLDPVSFTNESKAVVDFIADYYENIEKYPVQSTVEPGYLSARLPESAPYCPESLEDILKDVNDCIVPGLTHWQSPNFFAYFQANASTAGFLGEMLCSGFNVVGFNWISSPAATELESIVVDWMGKLLKLPSSFLFAGTGGGVLHGSTCEAAVCVLAAARDKALKELGGWEHITKLAVYASDQTHFTFQKAAKLVGIPPSNFRLIKTTFSTGFAMSPETVRSAVEDDIKSGLVPLFLCATIGTTPTGAVDPIAELGKVAMEFKAWLHIDAAYAGSACICPELRHHLDGVELSNSISMNPHKWFLTNMDCCCLWIKEPHLLTDSLSSDPEYLKNNASKTKSVVDYKDWQIALSRRFRALKLWIVIRRHGLANLMYHIRSDIAMAKHFEALVRKDGRFEIVMPRKFSLVCFRLKPTAAAEAEDDGRELNSKLVEAINSSGRAFMSHAVAGGVYVIRCAIGSTLTQQHHVDALWKLVQEKAQSLLTNHSIK